jgi:hypothetical protein
MINHSQNSVYQRFLGKLLTNNAILNMTIGLCCTIYFVGQVSELTLLWVNTNHESLFDPVVASADRPQLPALF